jgi:sigma-B regulation protein RsbU (phosphoserine phosphatase)
LGSFGIFVVLYGVRLVSRSALAPALGISPLASGWVSSLVTYLINAPAWFFVGRLLGAANQALIRWWVGVVSVFAVLGIACDLALGRPGTLADRPNSIVVLVGLPVGVIALWRRQGAITAELRVLFLGLGIFSAFAINDNLVGMGLVPWRWHEESLGFAIFVGCLAWIAARGFFQQERQLAALDGELRAARLIQTSLLPQELPASGEIAIRARFRPSSAVAGDFYDVLATGPRGAGILVADVSGHGMPAALVASMVKVAAASQLACASRPAELLARVNATLCGVLKRGFVTAAYVFVDLDRREIVAANAGHPRPLFVAGSGAAPVEIGGQGPILGRFRDARYSEDRLSVAAGGRLLLYTDGLVEARDARGEMFGEERLFAFASRRREEATDSFCDALLDELGRFAGAAGELALEDDVTLVVVDVPGLG